MNLKYDNNRNMILITVDSTCQCDCLWQAGLEHVERDLWDAQDLKGAGSGLHFFAHKVTA